MDQMSGETAGADDGAAVLARIAAAGVLPIATLETADQAVPLARALLAGGIGLLEITFRSAATEAAIARIRERHPELLIGAGTVLQAGQVAAARRAGAQFIITPGFNPAIVAASLEAGLPILPGVNNPTGVEQALGFGLSAVKFFPAEASGGVPFIQALAGPYPDMRFLPTGGIGPGNLARYLALPNVLACAGSWIAAPAQAGRFAEATRLAAEARTLAAAQG